MAAAAACMLLATGARADEGMWVLKELNKQNIARMQELGLNVPIETIYSETNPCVANAVVIFGGGCSGITVSNEGLVFTNHHCGYGSIQKLSSVEHDYLKNGFVSQNFKEELPVEGLKVQYLRETVDLTDRIVPQLAGLDDEFDRIRKADSIGRSIADSVSKGDKFTNAEVLPFYSHNKYFLVVYDVFRDVRLVFAPPTSLGKFGGDTDNWMWTRHTCDFSVFRVYAGADNRPADYSAENKPYRPRYVAEVSLQGYGEKDYAMTIGFPGSTNRYLSSWGVAQRIEHANKPRIEVRGLKQDIWRKAMQASDAVRIKYASKYAGSSNYWKNSIGMNRGLANLDVIARKKAEEAAFAAWVAQSPERQARYGGVLKMLEEGYTQSNKYMDIMTYLSEAFIGGAEIVRLARMINSIDVEKSTPEEIDDWINGSLRNFYKDYEPDLDRQVLPVMLRVVRERVPELYHLSVYKTIDKKYKGDYTRYVDDLFKRTVLTSPEKVAALLKDQKRFKEVMKKDPAAELADAAMMSLMTARQFLASYDNDIVRGERLYLEGLQQMHPERTFYSDANFTMRASYGSIGGYQPRDAVWYNYFTTHRGILEKQDPKSYEFNVQPEILSLVRNRDFGSYANPQGDLQLCFLSNNDITGGNSGSPVFDRNARVIGLAFDGNWEAMSGDIAFEPDLQRTISVDIRYVLWVIDRWGKCPRLIQELKLVK